MSNTFKEDLLYLSGLKLSILMIGQLVPGDPRANEFNKLTSYYDLTVNDLCNGDTLSQLELIISVESSIVGLKKSSKI